MQRCARERIERDLRTELYPLIDKEIRTKITEEIT